MGTVLLGVRLMMSDKQKLFVLCGVYGFALPDWPKYAVLSSYSDRNLYLLKKDCIESGTTNE